MIKGSCFTIATSSNVKGIWRTGSPLSSCLKTLSQTCASFYVIPFLFFFLLHTSISLKISSVCTFSISAIGSRFVTSSTWMTLISEKHLTRCTIAETLRMFARNLLPRPAPSLAPLMSPAMSHISIYAGTTFSGLAALAKALIWRSCTATFATFGSIVQNG